MSQSESLPPLDNRVDRRAKLMATLAGVFLALAILAVLAIIVAAVIRIERSGQMDRTVGFLPQPIAQLIVPPTLTPTATDTSTPTDTPTPTNTPTSTATPLPTGTPTPVTIRLSNTAAVPAGQTTWYAADLLPGDLLGGSWRSVAGGDLTFLVQDPLGTIVYSSGMSYGSDVRIVAPRKGTYRLIFQAPGIFTNKVVEFSFSYPSR